MVAAAPYEKKVFSDEFLNELKNEIFRERIAQDPHTPPCKFCLSFF